MIEVLRTKVGSCKDFVNIFEVGGLIIKLKWAKYFVNFQQMCQLADIEVTTIQGFIKDAEYAPGKSKNKQKPGPTLIHHMFSLPAQINDRIH